MRCYLSKVGFLESVVVQKFDRGVAHVRHRSEQSSFTAHIHWAFIVFIVGTKKKTEVIKDELNPVWNEVGLKFKSKKKSNLMSRTTYGFRLGLSQDAIFFQRCEFFLSFCFPEIWMGLIWSTPIIGRERSGSSQGLGKDREESVKCHNKGVAFCKYYCQKKISNISCFWYI